MVNAKFNKKWVKSGSLKNSNFALALIILTILSSVFTSGGSYAASRLKTRPTKTVLVPIPRYGFDPTEVAVPWKYLKAAGHRIVFATPDGTQGRADERMVSGRDLGILASVLMASAAGVQAYRELEKSPEFRNPISYDQIRVDQMDALFLPGGHDKGMREYLESKVLQQAVVQFFDLNKPVGAICHGTLLAGRSISPKTGKSVLWERKTTGLTQLQELTAFNLTRAYLGDYYRTYPKIAMEDDLKSYLRDPSQFDRGPGFPVPVSRDSMIDLRPGFTILDRNYLSARWPGDAHRFGRDFVQLLTQGGAGGAGQRTYYLSPKNFKGLRLRVGEFIPAGPIVGDILYLTGFADRLDNHGPLFDTWTKAGFRVVSFDYPSHGDTYGNGNNLDLFSIRNLGELAAFVENSTRVDRNRPLYLAGWSTGGLVAVRMLQMDTFTKAGSLRSPQGLILFAPGVSVYPFVGEGGKVTERTLTKNPNPPHLGPISPEYPALFVGFAADLLLSSHIANTDTLPREVPVLIFIAGETEDHYVKTANARAWVQSQRSRGVQISGVQCPKARHELDNEPEPIGGNEVRAISSQFPLNIEARTQFWPTYSALHRCDSF